MTYDLKISGEKVGDIIRDFSLGVNVLPIFQREYVWKMSNVKKLADSVLKGIPLGNIFLWTTQRELHTIDFSEYGVEDGGTREKHYIIDGGQRTVTLFGLSHGVKIGKVDFGDLYIDGRGNLEDFLRGGVSVYTKKDIRGLDSENEKWYIPMKYYFWGNVRTSELEEFKGNKDKFDEGIYQHRKLYMREEFEDYLGKIESLDGEDRLEIKGNLNAISTDILNREISVTKVIEGSLQEVLNLFERTNQEGIVLSDVEIMNATLYDPDTGFYYSDELDRLAEEMVNDFGVELRNTGKEPHRLLNNIVLYVTFGTYKERNLYESQNLFDSEKIRENWGDIKRAIYNAIEELGYNKNLTRKRTYRNVSFFLWSYFFYKNRNELQTREQQKGMDILETRLLGTSYLDKGGLPDVLTSLIKYIDEVVESKNEVVKFDISSIRSTYARYLTTSEIVKEANDANNKNMVFNDKWFYIQEVRGNKDLLTGRDIKGMPEGLEICHIFPENTDGDLANNVFNYIRQPKEVNDFMGHKQPRAWIDRASKEALDNLFIDDICVRLIKDDDLLGFISRRAELFTEYYTEGVEV